MYVCVCVNVLYVCVCVYVCMHLCMYLLYVCNVCTVCMYVMYVLYVCICTVCMYVCTVCTVRVYMYVCMYVCDRVSSRSNYGLHGESASRLPGPRGLAVRAEQELADIQAGRHHPRQTSSICNEAGAHTYTHIHIYIHTYIHTCTYIYTNIHTCTHFQVVINIQALCRRQRHTCTYTYTYSILIHNVVNNALFVLADRRHHRADGGAAIRSGPIQPDSDGQDILRSRGFSTVDLHVCNVRM